MNRREFVKTTLLGGIALVGGNGLAYPEEDSHSQIGLSPAAARRALAEHRIAEIEVKQSTDHYPRFVGRGAHGNPTRRGFGRQIRIVVTDKGVRGGAMSGISEEEIKKLIGARIGDIFDPERGTLPEASMIDLPLHDLAGQILEEPVYVLLGAKGPKQIPIYSSSIHFEDLEPWENPKGIPNILSAYQQDYETGYRAFKLKSGVVSNGCPGKTAFSGI